MSQVTRREWLGGITGLLGWGTSSGWGPIVAAEMARLGSRPRHCVLLWMTGGASQTDTFDMKPGHANGGQFQEIATQVPGLRWSEHLPKLALHADRLAVVRGLSTKEGDHGRGTFLMRTGQQPRGPVRYPTLGAALSKEMAGDQESAVNFVSVAPYRAFNQAAFSPGFLGPRYAPLTVGATDNLAPNAPMNTPGYADLKVDDLVPPSTISPVQYQRRVALWRSLQDRFLAEHRTSSPSAHDTVYRRALQLMDSRIAQAFDLTQEPDVVREAYGRGRFGQGCLMARRLIERGVSFVEVTLGGFEAGGIGWDTHANNFPAVRALSTELDSGWSMLLTELRDRGLLDQTTIVWMGEFGRTPKINENAGRDHFPAAWTCVLGGGGIRGGQAHGQTSADGSEVISDKVDVGQVLATVCAAVGVDPRKENVSEQGRPVKIADGEPIRELLA